MRYGIYGPFEIIRNGNIVSRNRLDKKDFWSRVENKAVDLSYACGCYLLIINNKVWYVGMAEKQSFRQECFGDHKIVQYDAALNEVRGVPYLLMVAKLTPSGKYASPSENGHRDIQLLEQLLIGSAIIRNPDLRNIKNTRLLRNMNVPGFLNSEQGQGRATSVQKLRQALSL
ncbi:MAG: hypothetical protein HY882_13075 [Deltaproteobacteria bacterium]|nr:hypothetical protein [Deltaproteobacteria bacterium]